MRLPFRFDALDTRAGIVSPSRERRVDIRRRGVLRALAAGGMLASDLPRAGHPDEIRRVGWLTFVKDYGPSGNRALNLFRGKLAELGWVDGRNIVIEPRWAETELERLPALAAELVKLRVDVIVTQTNAATWAAKESTVAIPIVMTGASEPVRFGIVASFARPGGNITGVTHSPGAGFVTKMAQLLKQAAPGMSRLAVLGAAEWDMTELESAAPRFGLTIVRAPTTTHHEVPSALAAALRAGANGLFAPSSSFNDPNREAIVAFALAQRWPAIFGDRAYVTAGGLMSYWTDWDEIRRQTAIYVDKILRGAKPGELPIVQPTKFLLVLNLRTAATLGLAVSRELRSSADELIG